MKVPVFYGDKVLLEDFPQKTRVLTSPSPLKPLIDPIKAVREALDNPLNEQPLTEALRECKKITIAFDDPVLPIPLPREDSRKIIIREVLKMAREFNVRVKLFCANGLHRKWSKKELSAIIGEHATNAICHDGEDKENLKDLGSVNGMPVVINKEAAESDLLVYANVTFTPMNGGWKSVVVGLGSYESISCHHSSETRVWGIMEPEKSKMHEIIWKMGKVVEENVRVFQVETIVTNELQKSLSLLGKKGLQVPIALKTFSMFPRKLREIVRNRVRATYKLAHVVAGKVEDVHVETLKKLRSQIELKLKEQFEIVVIGIPNMSPYATFSIQNPILSANLALGYGYSFLNVGKPLLKKNGVFIFFSPMEEVFHEGHHPSYVEFYKLLKETRDPWELREKYEKKFAQNEMYVRKYRHGYAYHGAHPFFLWYAMGPALEQASAVINVAPLNPEVPNRFGFDWAKNLGEAINKAYSYVGKDASIVYPAMPPIFCTRVE